MSSTAMRARTRGDRTHRTVLTLVALLLFTGGLAALLAGSGLFGNRFQNEPVFANPVGRYAGGHSIWIWPVAAVVALLVGRLALRWLLTLTRTPTVTELDLSTPAETSMGITGRTYLQSAAVVTAVTQEIEGYRGVVKATGQLQGNAHHPRLHLTVALHDDVDVLAVRQRIESEAIPRARTALDRPDTTVDLDLQITTKSLTRTMR